MIHAKEKKKTNIHNPPKKKKKDSPPSKEKFTPLQTKKDKRITSLSLFSSGVSLPGSGSYTCVATYCFVLPLAGTPPVGQTISFLYICKQL